MITKLNTYESVPIGTSNFEDFLSYIRSFMGANFGFSTNALDNDGGYFLDDNFGWVQFGTTSPNQAWIYTPQGKPEGNLFGRKNSEYFRLLVLNAEGQLPQVSEWEVLATSATEVVGGLEIANYVATDPVTSDPIVVKPLPYRPLRVAPGTHETTAGYYDIRFNGIPQDINTTSFTVDPATSFHNQTVEINSLRLGAEFPRPVLNGRYDGSLGPTGSGFTDLLDLNDPNRYGTPFVDDETRFGATLEFPNTNFAIDYGGHILLWDYNETYAYIPQDISSSPDPAPGTYKVIDFARGIIKLNVTAEQIDTMPRFTVISAEQLQESVSGGIPSYHTRYGSIYDGNSSLVKLVSYTFDGLIHKITELDEGDISASTGSILTSDISGSFGDSVILAVEYYGIPNKVELENVQGTRYVPDTFTFYYSVGMHNHIGGSNTSTFRGLIEHNDASWYNRDVLDADYFPVARVRNTWYSPITTAEAALWDDGVFDLNFPFAIVDTIQLQELADVPSNLNDGDILEYNGTTFDNTPFELKHLNDVNINPSSTTDRFILNYNHATSNWIESSITSVLGYNPVNRAGDTGITDRLAYSGNVDLTGDSTLITRKYVDDQISGINTVLNGLVTIEGGTGLNSSTVGNVKTLSVKYGDSAGTAAVGNDPRIVNAVPNTRTISAGDGLSGGGDLTNDRTLSVDSTVIRTTGAQSMTGQKEFILNSTSGANSVAAPMMVSRMGNSASVLGAGIEYVKYATSGNPPAVAHRVYAGLGSGGEYRFSIYGSDYVGTTGKVETLGFAADSTAHPRIYAASNVASTQLTLQGNRDGNSANITLAGHTTTASSRRGTLSIGGSTIATWQNGGMRAGYTVTANSPGETLATKDYVQEYANSVSQGSTTLTDVTTQLFGYARVNYSQGNSTDYTGYSHGHNISKMTRSGSTITIKFTKDILIAWATPTNVNGRVTISQSGDTATVITAQVSPSNSTPHPFVVVALLVP